MNVSHLNGLPAPRLNALLQRSSRRRTARRVVGLCCVLLLMLVVVILTGCASPPKPPCEPLPPVLMPALSQPLPPTSYSISAGQSFKRWQSVLMGIRPM